MKRFVPLVLLMTNFSIPVFASYSLADDDDEGAEIAQALKEADEKAALEADLAAVLPEMRRTRSVNPAVLNTLSRQEQLSADEALAISIALEESKTQKPKTEPKAAPAPRSSKSTQLEDDAALARKLQAELNAPAQSRGTTQEQLDADFAFALSLSVEKEPSKAKPMPSPQDQFFIPEVNRAKLQTMVATYLQIRSNNKVAGLDVHAFNRAFVIPNREAVLAINKLLKLKEDHTLDAMIAEFQQKNVKTPNLGKALGMLKTYIVNNRVDAETGLKLTQIISWNYELAKNVHRYSDNTLFCMPNGDHVSALNYMARSLDENINEKGGCLPGFMGRMFDVNFHFLCELAGVKIA